jgi:protease-4
VEKVDHMVENVPLFPSEAVEEGFADKVVYLDAIQDRLQEKFGGHVYLEGRYPGDTPADMRWGTRPEIAVVVISGMIVRGRSGRTPIINETITGSDTLADIFGRLRHDDGVRAVVVRIDSPGGSAVASDLIFREIRRLAEEKPVVASMGNAAASGGYYAAAGADEIFASPNTLTGSIGIFAGKFSVSRLADLIGINTTRLQRGPHSGAFSLFYPWTATQREGVARSITYLYKLFIQQVARTRPLSPEEVDAVARGHIWDGVSAEERKLVDRIGGLMDAIHRAEELAGVRPEDVDYRLYPQSLGLFDVGAASVRAGLANDLLAGVFGYESSAAGLSANSALSALIRHIGRGILLPTLYEDAEPLMLLPFVVEVD